MSGRLASWRTSVGGLVNIMLGIYMLTEGHTNEGAASITTGVALLFARDNAVTSEQAGAKRNQ